MSDRAESYINVNNHQVFVQYWRGHKVKAVMVLIHGMGEHSTKYGTDFVPRFLERDIAVIAFDHFGHGKSSGKRGVTPGYEYHLQAVDKVIEKAQELFADVPLIIFGQSMGGNVAANYMLSRHNYDLGILSSPFLDISFKPSLMQMFFIKVVNYLFPKLTQKANIEIPALSRDPQFFEKRRTKDPLSHNRISAGYAFPFLEKGLWAMHHSAKLSQPTLVLHGSGDRITSFRASQQFCENSKGSATLVAFDDGYHELYNDLCKEEYFAKVFDFIEHHLGLST